MKSHSRFRPGLLVMAWAMFAWLPAVEATAQQRGAIQGRVLETPGQEPIAGAQVQIVGTQIGTLTNNDGAYRISLAAGSHQVEVRALGHRTVRERVTVQAGETATINFSLAVSALELSEVVASVAAGEVRRRELGVDIATVNVEDDLDRAVVSSVSELLNGRAGNVNIQQASGNVGSGSKIRIRGINSLTQENNPLLIIDGVRASNDTGVGINRGQTFSRFDDLNPQDIARIQVIKGPAATALYGSEAAPGVVIIETKQGQTARSGMDMRLSYEQGFLWDTEDYWDNLADVTEFVSGADDPRLEEWRVDTNPVTGQVFVRDNPFEDEDTSPFSRGHISQTNLQVTGRTEGVSYFTSFGYDDRSGVLPSNDLQRYNFRGSFRATPTEKVDVNVTAGYVSSETNLPKSGGNTSGFFTNAQDGLPFSAFGTGGSCLATVLTGEDPDFCTRRNGNIRATFDKIAPIISRENLERFTASIAASYRPFQWWTNQLTVGTDVVNQQFTDAIPFDPDVPFSFAAGGENFMSRNQIRNRTVDLASTANYGINESIGGATSVGVQYFQDLLDGIACEGRVFVNDQATACDAAVSLRGFSDLREKVEIGGYLQQRFSYNDYLFLTGALRVDDNSALGVEEDAIWSPSVNTSLVVSDMPFWQLDSDLLSSLRLRAAWGNASQSPAQFAADRTFGTIRLVRGGSVVLGLTPDAPGNPNLGPERSEEFEFGFNAGLWNDRVALDFTYFDRTTTDAIVQRPVPPSSGFANVQFVNLGELSNTGFEVNLDALLVDRDDVTWNVGFIWSGSDPIITSLGLPNPVSIGFSQWFVEGYAPGAYFTRIIDSAERDAEGNIIPGSITHVEGDDIGDGRGLLFAGSPLPTNEQSLSTTLTLFRRLTLSTLFDRSAGHQVYSDALEDRNPGTESGIRSSFGEEWAFRQTNMTPVQQAAMEQDNLVGNHNQVWIRDADFIKWRELKLSYDLPPRLTGMLGGSAGGAVYIGARNLATFTDYPGVDPEANERGARDNLTRVEDNVLPPPFTFFSGVRVNF